MRGNLHPLGRSGRGGTVETSQALTCHPAVVIYCQPCHEAVICLSQPTNPGQSSCEGNLHPLGRSGHGGSVEMLQSLGCHPAVKVVYVVLSLDALSLQAKKVKWPRGNRVGNK